YAYLASSQGSSARLLLGCPASFPEFGSTACRLTVQHRTFAKDARTSGIFWKGAAVAAAAAAPAGRSRLRTRLGAASAGGPDKLERFLSKAGVLSREQARVKVREGIVKVNGRVVKDPWLLVSPGSDKVEAGLLAPHIPALRPVGRLDAASVGLLLLTDSSGLSARLLEPGTCEKEYLLRVSPAPGAVALSRLREGIDIRDGNSARGLTKPCQVDVVETAGRESAVLRFAIQEGRNRQLRRMCADVGLDVEWLMRLRIGTVRLGKLPLGQAREVTKEELASLLKSVEACGHQQQDPDPRRQLDGKKRLRYVTTALERGKDLVGKTGGLVNVSVDNAVAIVKDAIGTRLREAATSCIVSGHHGTTDEQLKNFSESLRGAEACGYLRNDINLPEFHEVLENTQARHQARIDTIKDKVQYLVQELGRPMLKETPSSPGSVHNRLSDATLTLIAGALYKEVHMSHKACENLVKNHGVEAIARLFVGDTKGMPAPHHPELQVILAHLLSEIILVAAEDVQHKKNLRKTVLAMTQQSTGQSFNQ
ncbi:unnamed protein product, partial [Polarella glacialis]